MKRETCDWCGKQRQTLKSGMCRSCDKKSRAVFQQIAASLVASGLAEMKIRSDGEAVLVMRKKLAAAHTI